MQTMLFHWNTIAVVGFFRSTTLSTNTKPSYKKALSNDEQGTSFAVSVSTDHNLNFRSSQNPDSVLALLRNDGFSKTQISKLVTMSPTLLDSDPEKTPFPKIQLLRQLGVPQSSISFMFTTYPQLVALKHSRFVKAVEEARQMGFDPSKVTFVLAIRMLYTMTDSKWESKCEVFGKWGWSKDDTVRAFRKWPLIMNVSDTKIEETMDFLVNKMGWPWASRQIARIPSTLCFSLEKNIVPKCYVFRALQMKGLIKQEFPLTAILSKGKKYFLDRYVTRFEESIPFLLYIYEGDVDHLDYI